MTTTVEYGRTCQANCIDGYSAGCSREVKFTILSCNAATMDSCEEHLAMGVSSAYSWGDSRAVTVVRND